MQLESGVAVALVQVAAVAPISPLDWELPNAAGEALKNKKIKKKNWEFPSWRSG